MNNNQDPQDNTEDLDNNLEDNKTPIDSIADSIKFVVDMMNSGKPNAKDVYPRGRYHGD
jgi:hypothetical protein